MIHTLRYRMINRVGLLARPNGRPTRDAGKNPIDRACLNVAEKALASNVFLRYPG